MTYSQFVTQWNGKGIDFDGYYGFQCMDLAHKYAVDCVGKDFSPAPAAKDVWNQNIDGYDKIANSLTGVPTKGDIVIWGTGVGAYGHIAIFDHGDANTFTSFDQNWPLNSLCHLQNHNYTGVLGWFHPKAQSSEPMATITQKELDKIIADRDAHWNEITALKNDLSAKDGQIANLNKDNLELKLKLDELDIQLDDVGKLLKECENKPPVIKEVIKEKIVYKEVKVPAIDLKKLSFSKRFKLLFS